MKRLPLVVTAVLVLALGIIGCSQTQTPPPKTYTPPTPPNLTAQQAIGVVVAAIQASTPAVRASSGWFEAKFNYSSRQWTVEVWSSENASKEYAGAVYIIDDAAGKLTNPPPVYNPKSSQSTQSSEPTIAAPIVPSAPTAQPITEAPLPTSETPKGFTTAKYLFDNGVKIMSSERQPVFLGRINNKYDTDSILNRYGNYGSKYSSDSIWNKYGNYGGKYSSYSPFNRYTSTPPKIYVSDTFWGYLSTNKYLSINTLDPNDLLMFAYLKYDDETYLQLVIK
ncbi:MAG: hypothetical protein Q8O55_12065 [Dehalococcoidales bacterium]|nr:hypothetical protein [Dehalococcoidales bacterium]